MATMNKVQLAPNVPLRMSLRYVDVYPNNPENNYGASVRLKRGRWLCLTCLVPACDHITAARRAMADGEDQGSLFPAEAGARARRAPQSEGR